MKKKPYSIDVPVLLIFFNRCDTLAQTFEEVKKARPSKLYLHQDGPRKNKNDQVGIQACRDLFTDDKIDWECEIHRLYQTENLGCDPAEYIAQKWFFDHEEMGIVLEDDDVPSQSFFPYAKELLEKYKNDKRISIICGTNPIEICDYTEDSYIFTKVGSIWGWASWRRFFELEDPTYSWLDNPADIKHIQDQLQKDHFKSFISAARWHRETGKAYYETLYQAAQYLNNGYAIVPKYNMIKNIGVTSDSVHNVSDIRLLPRNTQKIFMRNKYEIEFPLKHPSIIQRDYYYERKKMRNVLLRRLDQMEYAVRILYYQGPAAFVKKAEKLFNTRNR